MRKRFLSIVTSLFFLMLLLVGCGKDGTEKSGDADAGEDGIHIAVISGEAGLGDNGYNDEVYKGVEMAEEKLGITYDYVEPKDISDVETQLRAFSDAEEYDLVIVTSNDHGDTLKMVAEDYPEQKFTMLDAPIEGFDNISSVYAAYPDQHFLSGALAGIATQDDRFELAKTDSNILGFTIAVDTPTSRGQAAGFLAGAKYVNPDVQVLTNFIGGFNDPATAKELALMMYERGADVVSANAGSSTQGVLNAAKEIDRYAIGTSLNMIDPDHSLAISLKKSWDLIFIEIESLDQGTWEPGLTILGIPEGVADYDTTGLNIEIPDDVTATLDDIRDKVTNGEIEIPGDIDQVDDWAIENQYNE